MQVIIKIIIVVFLTIISQVGGLVYLVSLFINKQFLKNHQKIKRFSFMFLYLFFTFILIPPLAKMGGRVPLPFTKNSSLVPHSYLYVLLNRHYVKPQLRSDVLSVSKKLQKISPSISLTYLDANFPFIDGFPLLPHLSHNDGKKIDLSFQYTFASIPTNLKPSRSGYGVFVDENKSGKSEAKVCKAKGYWQYDYSKYFSFGSRCDLAFDPILTKRIIQELLACPSSQKLFLEPHLKVRMGMTHSKIRFQGCHSVRHDDHIHYQIKG